VGLNSVAKDLNLRIPAVYHHFLDMFGEQMVHALPLHRTSKSEIDLEDDTDPLLRSIYALSAVELKL
jgi:hypothetical protein